MRTWYSGAALGLALMGAVAFTNGSRANDTAPIEGRVMDLEGLVLQFAHVRVTDETTGASTETLSALNGRFIIANLEPTHTYAVDVRCIGFVPYHAAGIHPTSTGAALADVTMEPIPRLSAIYRVAHAQIERQNAQSESIQFFGLRARLQQQEMNVGVGENPNALSPNLRRP